MEESGQGREAVRDEANRGRELPEAQGITEGTAGHRECCREAGLRRTVRPSHGRRPGRLSMGGWLGPLGGVMKSMGPSSPGLRAESTGAEVHPSAPLSPISSSPGESWPT